MGARVALYMALKAALLRLAMLPQNNITVFDRNRREYRKCRNASARLVLSIAAQSGTAGVRAHLLRLMRLLQAAETDDAAGTTPSQRLEAPPAYLWRRRHAVVAPALARTSLVPANLLPSRHACANGLISSLKSLRLSWPPLFRCRAAQRARRSLFISGDKLVCLGGRNGVTSNGGARGLGA